MFITNRDDYSWRIPFDQKTIINKQMKDYMMMMKVYLLTIEKRPQLK